MVSDEMKAAVLGKNGKISIKTVKKPRLLKTEVLIKVAYAGICGSDITIYKGKHIYAKPPLIMGHEFSGRVAELGSDANNGLKRGDKVVVQPLLTCGRCYQCRSGSENVCENLGLIGIDRDGAFAEYVRAPCDRVYKIPDTISYKTAAIIEPLAVATHAVRLSNLKVGDSVTVLGAGPIGLLLGQVSKTSGASQVFISDISKFRLKVAEKLGLKVINVNRINLVKEVRDLTIGRGADVTFDAAGVLLTARQMVEVTRIKGEIVIVSLPKTPLPVELRQIAYKEQTIIGTRVYTRLDFEKAIQLMAMGKIDGDSIISDILSLSEAKEGIELAEKTDRAIKVLLKP